MNLDNNTPRSDAVHVAMRGQGCPFCGSHETSGDSITIDNGKAYQEMGCSDCEKEWEDVYTLSGYRAPTL